MDLVTSKGAIATLTKFPQEIIDTKARIANIPLGPWSIYVSCSYSKNKTRRYWYNVSFGGSRNQLNYAMQQASNNARNFLTGFQGIRQWFAVDLPNLSKQFEDIVALIESIQGQIRRNEAVNPQQKNDLESSLDSILQRLETSSTTLNSGIQALATYLNQQKTCQMSVELAKQNLQKTASSTLQDMRNFINPQPCGHGDALSQLGRCQGQFDNSVKAFGREFAELKNAANRAQNALAILQGIILNLTTKLNSVGGKLKLAETAHLGSIIQKIRINISYMAWKDMTSYAARELGNWR